eukprot:5666598-Pleurochrysis_carterae.AAC.1
MPNRTPVEVLNVWLDQDEARAFRQTRAADRARSRQIARSYENLLRQVVSLFCEICETLAIVRASSCRFATSSAAKTRA